MGPNIPRKVLRGKPRLGFEGLQMTCKLVRTFGMEGYLNNTTCGIRSRMSGNKGLFHIVLGTVGVALGSVRVIYVFLAATQLRFRRPLRRVPGHQVQKFGPVSQMREVCRPSGFPIGFSGCVTENRTVNLGGWESSSRTCLGYQKFFYVLKGTNGS